MLKKQRIKALERWLKERIHDTNVLNDDSCILVHSLKTNKEIWEQYYPVYAEDWIRMYGDKAGKENPFTEWSWIGKITNSNFYRINAEKLYDNAQHGLIEHFGSKDVFVIREKVEYQTDAEPAYDFQGENVLKIIDKNTTQQLDADYCVIDQSENNNRYNLSNHGDGFYMCNTVYNPGNYRCDYYQVNNGNVHKITLSEFRKAIA